MRGGVSIAYYLLNALSELSIYDSNPITTDELGNKILSGMLEFYKLFKYVAIGLAAIMLSLSIIIIIVGTVSKSGNTKKIGLLMFIWTCGGTIFFFCLPLIVSYIKYLSFKINTG